ncbi:MAG: 5-formyltetrahydrofolate cyclo-ligase [Candidatus Omnitrophica bacterium]|nr:5-formyltetrahydrofolate cyclo-ligase [Candidatus Omnitrophota bacterium]
MVIYTKQELRQAILDRILNQKEDEASFKSRVIGEKLLALPVFQKAKTILLYASIRGEVDTFAVIKAALALGKRVALPVVMKEQSRIIPVAVSSVRQLRKGAYGILEPDARGTGEVPLQEIDLVVVPGVVFDTSNNRLGRGAGYYDRLLAKLPPQTPTVGLAFDCQIVDVIPGLEPHDRPVTQVLSN